MESNNIDLLQKMVYIYLIIPYYDYAYESVKMIKELSRESRHICNENYAAITKALVKQRIDLCTQTIDQNSINVLKRNNKYMLFKFYFYIKDESDPYIKLILLMLDEMPDLEVEKCIMLSGSNSMIQTLADKPMFKTKHDLFKILDFRYSQALTHPEPYEYISFVNANERPMDKFCKYADCVQIDYLYEDLYIDWKVNTVIINGIDLFDFKEKHGSQEFFDSVTWLKIKYKEFIPIQLSEFKFDWIFEYFYNLQKIDLSISDSLTNNFENIFKTLSDKKVKQISIGCNYRKSDEEIDKVK